MGWARTKSATNQVQACNLLPLIMYSLCTISAQWSECGCVCECPWWILSLCRFCTVCQSFLFEEVAFSSLHSEWVSVCTCVKRNTVQTTKMRKCLVYKSSLFLCLHFNVISVLLSVLRTLTADFQSDAQLVECCQVVCPSPVWSVVPYRSISGVTKNENTELYF